MVGTTSDWEDELGRWLEPFLERLGHRSRQRMCPLYVAGLIGPGDRKSVQPMAERLAPGDYDQLHHFVAAGVWKEAPLETELLIQADKLVGGSDAVLSDRRYVDAEERQALGRCRCAICFGIGQDGQLPDAGVTDAGARRGADDGSAAPFPPRELDERSSTFEAGWRSGRTSNGTDEAGDSARRDRSHDRSRCPLRRVLADAGYGLSAPFRQGLRRAVWPGPLVSRVTSEGVPCRRAAHLAHCRARSSSSAARPEHSIDGSRRYCSLMPGVAEHQLAHRHEAESVKARFAAVRVRAADRPRSRIRDKRSASICRADEAWLHRRDRPLTSRRDRNTILPTCPPTTGLRMLSRHRSRLDGFASRRISNYQEELGLDHFEGRSWQGLSPVDALMTMIAYAFLQTSASSERAVKKINGPATSKPSLPAVRHAIVDLIMRPLRAPELPTMGPRGIAA